jgi:carbon-monoxide dehydrogenase medium subunit
LTCKLSPLKGIRLRVQVQALALVTHTETSSPPGIQQHPAAACGAAPHIAHRAIRNLGTFGGSITMATRRPSGPPACWP